MQNINLETIRKTKSITQVELAERCNVTQGTISAWESGLWFPSFSNLVSLSKALDCTVDDLIREDKPNVK